MKHYISPIAKSIVISPESAMLTSSIEIPLSDDKTHHYDAPERMFGDWSDEWEDAFASE